MRVRTLPSIAIVAIGLAGCIPASAGVAPHTGGSVAAPAVAPARTYLFDEEFSGRGLNLSRWQPNWLGGSNAAVTKPVNSAEVSCYAPAQASVPGDGYLHLSAVARSCTVNGKTYPYTSGLVETAPHFTFSNGHLEARVFLPGSGSQITDWPALWTDGTGTWPATGESDIVEGLGGRACFHYHSPAGSPGGCVAARFTGWHTYAEDVRNGTVTYYYDGAKVGTLARVNARHYVVLNLGVGGQGGPTAPATMLVDYVRVSA